MNWPSQTSKYKLGSRYLCSKYQTRQRGSRLCWVAGKTGWNPCDVWFLGALYVLLTYEWCMKLTNCSSSLADYSIQALKGSINLIALNHSWCSCFNISTLRWVTEAFVKSSRIVTLIIVLLDADRIVWNSSPTRVRTSIEITARKWLDERRMAGRSCWCPLPQDQVLYH